MSNSMPIIAVGGTALFYVAAVLVTFRILLRAHRDPASRIAWMFVVFALPGIGIIAYLLFWETKLSPRDQTRADNIKKAENEYIQDHQVPLSDIPQQFHKPFTFMQWVNKNVIAGWNKARLTKWSHEAIMDLIHDIDNAKKSVHISFYIWLDDDDGLEVIDAVIRAHERWVSCKILVDALGSKKLIRWKHWKELENSGVSAHIIFPVMSLRSRVDIRNHRKIAIIDEYITYNGSQNCCKSSFYVKAKYAPWTDIMVRITGPVAWQNQKIFISDWFIVTGEDISPMLSKTPQPEKNGIPAVAIGTGPSERYNAASHSFESVFSTAQKKLYIVTPYYVPSYSIQSSICQLAESWIDVKMIFTAHSDSFVVQYASRSYYRELLESWVEIYEHQVWILHSKIALVDDDLSFIGSANLDRRSFDLNYENNILLHGKEITSQIYERFDTYIEWSEQITLSEVCEWSKWTQIKNNLMATIGPLL